MNVLIGMVIGAAIVGLAVFFYVWAKFGDMLDFREAWNAPDDHVRPWFRAVRRLFKR